MIMISKGYIPRLICFLSTLGATYITIEEVVVEYLTHVLSNYMWKVDKLVINL